MRSFKNVIVLLLIMSICISSVAVYAQGEENSDSIIYETEDDFDSYTANYPFAAGVLGAPVGGNWRTRSTMYYGQAGIEEDPTNTGNKVLKINAYTNYILTFSTGVNFVCPDPVPANESQEIQFDVYKDNERVGAGIKFLMSGDETTGYALDFPGSQAGGRYSYRLYKMNNLVDDFTLLTEGESGDLDDRLPLYTWFTVKVTIEGDTISWVTKDRASGAVQSKWSGSYTSPTSLPENTGIQLFGENAKMDGCFLYFDNFKYTVRRYDSYVTGKKEKSNVLYFNVAQSQYVDENNIMDLKDLYLVRRFQTIGEEVYAPSIVDFSADGTTWITDVDISFDGSGKWLNTVTGEKIRYIRFYDSSILDKIKILAEVGSNDTCSVPVGSKLEFVVRFENEDCTDSAVWTSSNPNIFTVENGIVNVLKDGPAILSVTCGPHSKSVNITAIGEITYAKQNGTVAEYMRRKQPIINAVNTAIAHKDSGALLAIINGDEDYKLEDIQDFNYSLVRMLTDEQKQWLSVGLLDYPAFRFDIIDDMYDLIRVFETEIALFDLWDLDDAATIEQVFIRNADYFNLPLDNEYYLQASDDVLAVFADLKGRIKNTMSLSSIFKEKYVMINFVDAYSYAYIEKLVSDCAEEIGYNVAAYNKVLDKLKLAQYLLRNQSKIKTAADLAEYIDNYKEETQTPGSNVSTGSNSKSTGVKINIPIGDVVKNNINIDSNTLSEKQVFFSDLGIDHWAYESVRYLKATNTISGYEDGTFKPDNNITRAEFLKILFLALKVDMTAAEEINDEFNDCNKDDWYCSYFAKAKEVGVIVGDDQNNCLPNNFISRQEAAVIVYRAIESLDKTLNRDSEVYPFSDGADIADWASSAVAKLQAAGIVDGTNNCFMPRNPLTRAEGSKIIHKTVNSFGTEERENG